MSTYHYIFFILSFIFVHFKGFPVSAKKCNTVEFEKCGIDKIADSSYSGEDDFIFQCCEEYNDDADFAKNVTDCIFEESYELCGEKFPECIEEEKDDDDEDEDNNSESSTREENDDDTDDDEDDNSEENDNDTDDDEDDNSEEMEVDWVPEKDGSCEGYSERFRKSFGNNCEKVYTEEELRYCNKKFSKQNHI